MATKSTTPPQTSSPRIDPSIPHDVQRHLQLIYDKLNNHARAFQSLPKASGPAPVNVKTFFPRMEPSIPHEVQRHLQLIYGKLNNHAVAFSQLPKVDASKAAQIPSNAQTSSPRIEQSVPSDIQRHLQLIYLKLDNHTRAFEFYKTPSTTAQP